MAASARLTTGPTSGRPSAAAPPQGSERPASRPDEELLHLLTWDTPLP